MGNLGKQAQTMHTRKGMAVLLKPSATGSQSEHTFISLDMIIVTACLSVPLFDRISKIAGVNCVVQHRHAAMAHKVDLRDRSNINRMATASLHTKGSMLHRNATPISSFQAGRQSKHAYFTNSRCPPRSHIEKTICVLRIDICIR